MKLIFRRKKRRNLQCILRELEKRALDIGCTAELLASSVEKITETPAQFRALTGKVLALEHRLDQVLISQNQLIVAVNKALKK